MSIQAAELRTDVVADTSQAIKTLTDFDAQLKALAETSHDPVVVTANTTQAQEQIAALGAAGSTTAPVEITPQVDTTAAKASVDGLADDIKAKLKDSTPEITPKANTAEARSRLEQLFADIRNDVQKTNAELGTFGESLGKLGSAFDNIQNVAGGLSFITAPLINAASAAEEAYEGHEKLSQSLTSLTAKELLHTGAAKDMTDALALAAPKAEELLKWNQQLALHSPFDEEGVAQAFRMAQSLGFVSDSSDATVVSAKRLTQTLTDWSTATSVGSEGMQRVTLALGQIQQKGKLAGDEVMQLVEAGVNVDQILGQAFGKSTAEIQQMREKGLIPANDAILAVVQSLENDYAGAAARSGATMEGLRNSLEDLQKIGLREFFSGTFEAIQPQLQKFVDTANNPDFQKNLHAIGMC